MGQPVGAAGVRLKVLTSDNQMVSYASQRGFSPSEVSATWIWPVPLSQLGNLENLFLNRSISFAFQASVLQLFVFWDCICRYPALENLMTGSLPRQGSTRLNPPDKNVDTLKQASPDWLNPGIGQILATRSIPACTSNHFFFFKNLSVLENARCREMIS